MDGQGISPASSLCLNCNASLPDVIVPEACPKCGKPVESFVRALITVGKDAAPVRIKTAVSLA